MPHSAMTTGGSAEAFLTVAEVAEILRLNQQTVRNWIDAGSLPAVRVGRRVRIRRTDLDSIIEQGYRGAPMRAAAREIPSAEGFWNGEPVGAAEPAGAAKPVGAAEPESVERAAGSTSTANGGLDELRQ